MKKLIYQFMLAAVLTIVWGCSSDSSNDTHSSFAAQPAPQWKVDWFSNETTPNWQEPDQSRYEHSMYLIIRLCDELAPFSTDDDLMAVFIGDECRSLSKASKMEKNGKVYFVEKVRGNDSDTEVYFTLKYYSGGLHQTFTLDGTNMYIPDLTYGIEQDFAPYLPAGSSKYPLQMVFFLQMPENLPFTPSPGDKLGVFVNGECRGVCIPSESVSFVVYAREEGETCTLQYYSAEKQGVYTLDQTIETKAWSQSFDLMLNF